MFSRHRLKKVTSVEDLRSLAEQRVPRACFQCRYGEMQEVLRVQRGIMPSDCLHQAMLRWTESRGTHARLDFPQTSDAWLQKQMVRVVDGMARFADAPL